MSLGENSANGTTDTPYLWVRKPLTQFLQVRLKLSDYDSVIAGGRYHKLQTFLWVPKP